MCPVHGSRPVTCLPPAVAAFVFRLRDDEDLMPAGFSNEPGKVAEIPSGRRRRAIHRGGRRHGDDQYHLAPQLLLEIAECVATHNAGATIQAIWRLQEPGMWAMIDEFGTGYSRLGSRRRFLGDTLQLDLTRSFRPSGAARSRIRSRRQ
jgi:hypothetical protein